MQVQSGLQGLFRYIRSQCANLLWPKILGGTPRWYRMVTATPNQSTLSRSGGLAEKGLVSPMIDSEWEMEDVLEVGFSTVRFLYTIIDCILLSRHTKSCIPSAQKGQSWFEFRNRSPDPLMSICLAFIAFIRKRSGKDSQLQVRD